MFVLTRIQDSIPIHPQYFGLDVEKALKDAINKKYANNLIPSIGLAISVYDISTCTEGVVRYGDGLLWYKTIFRLIVFSPSKEEVLVGKVHSCTENHLRLSLGFFSHIYVQSSSICKPSAYDAGRRAWYWAGYAGEDATEDELQDVAENERFYFEPNDVIRFRIDSLSWQEKEPLHPSIKNKPPARDPKTGLVVEETEEERELKRLEGERDAPLKIWATLDEQGLGNPAWWNQPAEGEGGEEGAEGEGGEEEYYEEGEGDYAEGEGEYAEGEGEGEYAEGEGEGEGMEVDGHEGG